ncbi:MAG: hypothetical protein WAT68_07335 [Candidatus Nitrotoga sp.]
MAHSINEAANVVNALLECAQVCIDGEEKMHLSEHGDALICGFRCKVVNVLTLSSFRVLVNTSWFNSNPVDYSKPRMQRGSDNPGIDYQLIPTKNKLLAVHYLDLRQYTLWLEKEREHWFGQSYWGMQVNEEDESFVWTGGNTVKFPLLRITRCGILQERDRILFESMRRF